MDAIESRSDSRSMLIPASPFEVFAAMRDPARIAKWWGPNGFTNTIHQFDFEPGGSWFLTMHGPDGTHYPNESRFTRITDDQVFEIEHLDSPHFFLTITLEPKGNDTNVKWLQTFDTIEHYQQLAQFVAAANQQNLERLTVEVLGGKNAA